MARGFPRRRRPQPESAVVNACIRWLWLNGCYVWRNNSGGYKSEVSGTWVRYGLPGSSDILGVSSTGRFIACEAKSAKGTLSEKQVQFKQEVEKRGGLYILARSVDDLEARRSELLNAP